MKHICYFFAICLLLVGCDTISDSELVKEQENLTKITRAVVNVNSYSETNPDFYNNWENSETVNINTIGANGLPKLVTLPWADGSSSSLPYDFCKDIKKEQGWKMLFHTFKKAGLDEKMNYICLYNIFTGYIKVFYYYEGENANQGAQWYVKTSNGTKSKLFNLSDYLAIGDTAKVVYDHVLYSNLTGDPTAGITPGWNGFEFEIPYSEDIKNVDFTIGAYNKNVTNYHFTGKESSESIGTITTEHTGSSSGLFGSIGSLFGKDAKKFIDKSASKFIKSKKILDHINDIPSSGYATAIKSGLGLIFGKSTTVDKSDIKFTTNGTIDMSGTGTSQTTSGVMPLTVNLYNCLNSVGENHFLGVWTSTTPKVIYTRYTPVYKMSISSVQNHKYSVTGITKKPLIYNPIYSVSINPDLTPYIVQKTISAEYVRCDQMYGEKFKPKIIDIDDFCGGDHEQIYKDDYTSLYKEDNNDKTVEVGGLADPKSYYTSSLYYDWGLIDCGRLLAIVTTDH